MKHEISYTKTETVNGSEESVRNLFGHLPDFQIQRVSFTSADIVSGTKYKHRNHPDAEYVGVITPDGKKYMVVVGETRYDTNNLVNDDPKDSLNKSFWNSFYEA